ncbi:RsiV family protein [Mycobacterium sp. CVI_P3]|uniref:RsiV family protein n=1 Tax=Mycobacterium pinniadriaticum TaxID=2994102 RepID=A0ABT3SLG2_9MYCO|nr:esterase [Mycobacterium pinniadriaticum]MCX2933943.1 RsiV family protein [Mycobacterium pinniadriaticum]MCX2940365.1 RsiV family protein [Mycobacterium pinniadriaticum]
MRILSLAAVLATGVLLGDPAVAVSAAQDGCAALGGAVEAGNVCHVHSDAPGYMMDLKFPTDFADEQAVVDYLIQNRDGFTNVAQTPAFRSAPYEMDVTAQSFSSGPPTAGTQSVVLKLFQDVGGAHPTTWYKAFTYDVAQRKPVTFDTLFAPGVNAVDAIFPVVQRDLERQTGLTGVIASSDGLDPSHYQNFAITDDAVIFFFGQGVLLPSDAGATSASVPRAALPPLQL